MIVRILIWFGGFILSVSLALAASAQVTCDPVYVQHYRFAPRHEYIIHRGCNGHHSGFSIIYNGVWEGARATEKITYTYNQFLSTGQLWKTSTGEVRTAADCPRDPWLERGSCSRFTFEGDGTPTGELKTAIGEMPYPISTRLLSGSQRADLQNSFAQMTNIASQPVEIVAPAPWQVYQIDLPTDAGMTYHVGLTKRVMFIGRVNWPDTVGATQGYGIEFELTGPKRGEIKTFVGQFTPQGYVNTAMNLSPGAYNVRARLTGKHTGGMVAGPWGAWAGFNVVYLYPPANLEARPWGVSICTRRPVRLTWDYLTGGDGISFAIERALNNGGFQTIDEVDGKARSFVDNSDKPGGIYRYRVKARGNQVQEFSNEASVNFWPVDLPAAPSGLRKAPTQVSGSPSLQWQDNSNNESGFVIERQDPGQGAFKKVGQTEPNRHSFTDIGPKGATGNYAYRVRAIREEGCPSDYSNNLFVRIETDSGSAPGTPSLGGSDDTGNQGTERIRTDLGLTPMENRSAYAVNKPVAFQLGGAAVNNARFEFQHLQGGRWVTSTAPRAASAPTVPGAAFGAKAYTFNFPFIGKWRVRPLDDNGTPGKWETFEVAAGLAPLKLKESKAATKVTPLKKSLDAAKGPAVKAKIGSAISQIYYPRKNDRLWVPAIFDVKLIGGAEKTVKFEVEKMGSSGRFKPYGTYSKKRITLKEPGHYRIRVEGSSDWTPFSVQAKLKAVQPAKKQVIEAAPAVKKTPTGVRKPVPASQ